MHALLRLHDRLTTAGLWAAMVAMTAIVLAYVVEVFLRYALGTPTRWSNDLISYLLLAMTFLAMPAVTASGGHVAVTALQERLPPRAWLLSARIIAVLGVLVCVQLTLITAGETLRQWHAGIRMMAAWPVPKAWISVWIIYGFASSALHFARIAWAPSPRPTIGAPAA